MNVQDQYINHIMNETGATVVLRGRGSGNPEGLNGEGILWFDLISPLEKDVYRVALFWQKLLGFQSDCPLADGQQPLHLFLSNNNAKGLDDAKRLAENLLDTISAECGASRYLNSHYFTVYDVQVIL